MHYKPIILCILALHLVRHKIIALANLWAELIECFWEIPCHSIYLSFEWMLPTSYHMTHQWKYLREVVPKLGIRSIICDNQTGVKSLESIKFMFLNCKGLQLLFNFPLSRFMRWHVSCKGITSCKELWSLESRYHMLDIDFQCN